ncbi:MAG TPA: DUF2459 domain-containing protein [Acetobacteraceae bacterium]|nr:DUF2459 domain-containing protein [Acetobacteraceae bacterium]
MRIIAGRARLGIAGLLAQPARMQRGLAKGGKKWRPGPAMRLLGLLALAGCATMPAPHDTGPADETVYVIGRGWHTEIGVAVAALDPPLSALAARYPGAQALSFGFGDRAFVLARHKGIGEALGALLPNPGLILVTVLNTSPAAAFGAEHVVALPVTREGFDAITDKIWNSLATDHGHLPAPYATGPYSGSVFYASRVRYDGFYTCNTWVAAALHAGGLPITPGGVLFASQVMYQARMAADPAKSP